MKLLNSARALWGRVFPTILQTPTLAPTKRFEDMLAVYFESLQGQGLSDSTIRNKIAAKNRLKVKFAERELHSIRPWEVARLIKEVHEQGLYVASRQLLSELKAMFNVALCEGWIDFNPAMQVKRLPAPVRRARLTLEQFSAVYEYSKVHLPAWFPTCLRLALITGQRRSDLIRMVRSDVRDGHLFVEQYKTGARVAIPLALRMDALDCCVGDVIDECLRYKPHDGEWLLRTAARPRRQLHPQTLSHRFWVAQKAAAPYNGEGSPPTLHEVRSLSARLYRKQGIDTQTLLGHTQASMTEIYEDDRGLTRDQWRYVQLPPNGAAMSTS